MLERDVTPANFSMTPPASASGTPHRWVVSWTDSVQGPYPTGNAAAQPDMQ